MALDLDCQTTEYYIGDGLQQIFTYAFEIIEETDLHVANYNTETKEYDEVPSIDNWFKVPNVSQIRFVREPEAGQKFVIYRLTEIDPMKAVFHPGHPVKAADLNDNFEQLQFAIEESRCFIEGQNDAIDGRYWKKVDETLYSDDPWISDDEHVASTAAIDAEIDDKLVDIINNIDLGGSIIGEIQDELEEINTEIDTIKDDITEINTEIEGIKEDITELEEGKVDKTSGITTEQQKTNQWVSDDEHFAFTGALSERYDVIMQSVGETAPQPEDGEIIQPGKFLITSDNNLYAWNGSQWFQPIAGGNGGGGGGQHTQIQTTSPITQGYDSATNTYSLSFDIISLPNRS